MSERPFNCKLIAVDLDGTLLDDDKRIPPANIAALRAAHARGIHIVAATGRPPRAASWVFEQLGVGGAVLGSGGACVELYPSGDILFEEYLDPSAVRDLALYCRANGCFMFAMKGSDYFYEGDGPEAEYIRNYMKYDGGRVNFTDGGLVFNKGDLRTGDPAVTRRVSDELAELLAGRANPVLADKDIIDVNPEGVDKGTALARLAGLLGCDISETMAFGDTDNDVAMIRAAGLGVCMANGMPPALAAADIIAPSNNEAGVAAVINDVILGGS